ncbi:MAG: histidine kinase [Frankiales bacterium]|nr:histidine kinase [Frankiales bacterium]
MAFMPDMRTHSAGVPVDVGIRDLARIVLSDSTLDSVLHRVSEAARRSMPTRTETSVTLVGTTDPMTAASTDALAANLDQAQYASGHGPCLDAARTGERLLIVDMALESRWPDWSPIALAHGAFSSLSVPLRVQGRIVGALNIYSRIVCGFDGDTIAIAESFASYAGVAVANAELYAATAALAANMEAAMRSRSVIEQAKGILMALHGIDADAAFAMLADHSQRSNRKLRDVAVTLVAQATHGQ